MSKSEAEAAAQMVASARSLYRTRGQRAAMRCAMGDSSALCDALVRIIEQENKGSGGKGAITKQGHALAAVAKRCGDAIWAMRDLVTHEDAE